MQKQPSERFLKKGFMRNFAEFTEKYLYGNSFFVFSCEFEKFVRTPFLQSSTGRLLLIIAVSAVAKGVLPNESVNYETRNKA